MAQNNRSPHDVFVRRWEGIARAFVLLGLVTSSPAANALSEQVPIGDYVHALESSYKDVRSLRAMFTQTYDWGDRSRVESGTVVFAKGGRMRWDYREPQEKLFASDGKQVILYIPEEKQMTRRSVKSSEDVRVPFRLLLSRVDLHRVFDKIEFAQDALQVPPENHVLRGIPKGGDDSGVHEVLFEITPQFDIRQLVIVYTDLSRMSFAFQEMQRNVAVEPGMFDFRPPAGTQIINQK
jgi:outer membrane lipoprotein carrier protein